VLFVPGGGRTGIGESARTLILADAARARWPDSRIGFITGEDHARLPGDGFERHTVAGRVSRSVEDVNRWLRELAPDLVVFDGRGQGSQIACASRCGARTVYIAAIPTTRRRVFRWSRLRRLDQIWIRRDFVDPAADLRFPEKARLLLARHTTAHFVQAICPPSDPVRLEGLRRQLGLGADRYVLFAPGGGGWKLGDRPVSELFAEAAAQVRKSWNGHCVVVLGPLYRGGLREIEGGTVVPALSTHEMAALVGGAEIVATGGGGLMGQALAARRVCVAAPTGGSDQPERVQRCAEAGLLVASPLSPDAIARRVLDLLGDPSRHAALTRNVERSGVGNGLPRAVALLEGLLAAS
jgi:hypothetical protein